MRNEHGLLSPSSNPAILVFDIENAPITGVAWERRQTDLAAILKESYLLGVGWKWLNEPHTHWFSIYQDPDFAPWGNDEKLVAERLWWLLDRADIVIGHNMEAFDAKKANSLFARYGLGPPSPYQVVDTLSHYRRHFKEDSYRLADIAVRYGLGEKTPHQGIGLWIGCMKGDPKAWGRMERYCRQDVRLTEAFYKFLLPWIGYRRKGSHPNLGHWGTMDPDNPVCPNCGSTGTLIKKGKHYTFVSVFQCYWCKPGKGGCGAWPRARLREPGSYPRGGPQAV